MKRVHTYYRDEAEYRIHKLCLDIIRSNLNKDQVKVATDAAFKVMDKAGEPAGSKVTDRTFMGINLWEDCRLLMNNGTKQVIMPSGNSVYENGGCDLKGFYKLCKDRGAEPDLSGVRVEFLKSAGLDLSAGPTKSEAESVRSVSPESEYEPMRYGEFTPNLCRTEPMKGIGLVYILPDHSIVYGPKSSKIGELRKLFHAEGKELIIEEDA